MGYNSFLSGAIRINPPIRWVDYRDSTFLAPDAGMSIQLGESVDTEVTDEGQTLRRTAVSIVPTTGDERSHYNVANELAALRAQLPAGAEFTGHLIREGAEQGDVERYWLDDTGQVRSEKAALRWPNGSEVVP